MCERLASSVPALEVAALQAVWLVAEAHTDCTMALLRLWLRAGSPRRGDSRLAPVHVGRGALATARHVIRVAMGLTRYVPSKTVAG